MRVLTDEQKKKRDRHLQNSFGITLEQYEELLAKQNNCCAICRRHRDEFKIELAVDHNHKDLSIRGVLCTYCNRRLVGRHTDSALVRRIADYLDNQTGYFVPNNRPRKRKRSKRNG